MYPCMLKNIARWGPIQSETHEPGHLLAGTDLVDHSRGSGIRKTRCLPCYRCVRDSGWGVEDIRNAHIGIPDRCQQNLCRKQHHILESFQHVLSESSHLRFVTCCLEPSHVREHDRLVLLGTAVADDAEVTGREDVQSDHANPELSLIVPKSSPLSPCERTVV